MSHFTSIETQIKDIGALRAACTEMGFAMEDNTEARGYGNNRIRGDHVIRLNGPYDIAVYRYGSGTYALTTDWYAGHVEKEVGHNFGKLLQLYGVHKAMLEARLKGCIVTRSLLKNGVIKLAIAGGTLS